MKEIALVLLLATAVVLGEDCTVLSTSDVPDACVYSQISMSTVPSGLLLGKSNCDSETQRTEWELQPIIYVGDLSPESTYTLVMLESDSQNQTQSEYYVQMMLSNIKGSDLMEGKTQSATQLAEYEKICAEENSGKHRYAILVFLESENMQAVSGIKERSHFDLLSWIQQQTKPLCGPIGGFQFRSQC